MGNNVIVRKITATLMAAILVASSSVAVFGQDGEVVLDPAESMLMDEQMQAAPESEDIILTAEQLAAIPPSTAEFEIDAKGVLTKYKGSGGDVVIPDGVTGIGDWSFGNCAGLTSVTIPNSVTSIESNAFYDCTGLTSVTIPSSVTNIGGWTFGGCTGLTNITVDAGNTSYSSEDGVMYNKDKTILKNFPEGKKGEFIIPNGVTSIDSSAFQACTGLTSVTIPNSVTLIKLGAFWGCTGLTNVTIPNSVTSIDFGVFWGCTGLTNLTIPNSVTSIGDYAFVGCTGLTNLTIPNSVTSIGDLAFANCTGLTNLTIPNSVTSIGDGAFVGCTGLTICGYKDSYAETYAKRNNIPFKIIEPQIPADLNGDGKVDLTDLMSVLHHVSKRTTFTQEQITIADVTHDGKVDINDLMKILHFVTGRIPSLD